MLNAVLLLGLLSSLQQSPDLEPRLDGCRLAHGAKELVPLSSSDGAAFVLAESGWELSMTREEIRFRRAGTSEPGAKVAAHAELECKAITGNLAWFAEREAREPALRRLDLLKATWLPKLVLDDAALGLEKREATASSVSSLLVEGASLIALREDLVGGQHGPPEHAGYVVARLEAVSAKPEWARRFGCAASEPRAGAFLMAPMLAYPSRSATRPLQRFGEDLLVCATEAESLLLLGLEKGETKWSVDRIWEFQRGYIGPSVWSHFLNRFGIELWGHEDEARRQAVAESRVRFDALYTATVTAGPFVVRKDEPWDKPKLAALVVVSLAPHNRWASQLTQPLLYEIDWRGSPCSVVALPRAVLGWSAVTIDDRVVFACMQGAFGCASTTANTGHIGDVGTAPDATGALRWYRELVPAAHEAWMSCDPAFDAVAISPTLGVRPAGGGWIAKEGDTLFHFPLWLLDPRDGSAQQVELRVPFEGSMTVPSTNLRRDAKSLHTWGWRGLALTKLELAGDKLLVWLANSKQSWKLEFDARELVPAK